MVVGIRKLYCDPLLYVKEIFESRECHEKFNNYLMILTYDIKSRKKVESFHPQTVSFSLDIFIFSYVSDVLSMEMR